MGGTRCSFRKCGNNSYNSPGMHFFQFPVKCKERLKLWIKFANANFIYNLTTAQQKNKRLCEMHFRDECFMNYKKDRLTPSAIPTLDRLENNLVLDYEESDNPVATELPPQTVPHLIPPKQYSRSIQANSPETSRYEIALDNFDNFEVISTDGTEPDLSNMLPQKKMLQQYIPAKCSTVKSQFHRLIKSYSASESILKRKCMREAEKALNEDTTIYDSSGITFENESEFDNENANTVAVQTEKITYNEEKSDNNSESHEIINNDEYIMEDDEISKFDNFDIQYRTYTEEISRYKKLLNEERNKSAAALSEVNRLLNSPSQVETVSTSNRPGTSQGPLTKAQLFNGIKKYLSPSMSSLVRMEMFAAPEREWKSDEKEISVDLLRLGSNIFDYFRDEWRIRLPPKKDVEKWLIDYDSFQAEEDL